MSETKNAGTLVDDLVARIEAAIFRGEFLPGTRLRESRLATTLGVGRGPLREAVRRLEGRKLIVRHANRGTSIATLSEVELTELFQVREGLEVTACRLAAKHITEEEVEKLRFTLQRHRDAELDPRSRLYGEWHNFDFHFQIAQASRNGRLLDILYGDIWSLLRLYRFPGILSPGRVPNAPEDHDAILDALARHDPDAADRLMRRHLSHAQEYLLQGIEARKKAVGRRRGASSKTSKSAEVQTLSRGVQQSRPPRKAIPGRRKARS